MRLYHGSTIDIATIDLTLSKPNKDFGRAFYLSDDRQQALEMVQFRAEFDKKNSHQSSKEPQWNKDTMKE